MLVDGLESSSSTVSDDKWLYTSTIAGLEVSDIEALALGSSTIAALSGKIIFDPKAKFVSVELFLFKETAVGDTAWKETLFCPSFAEAGPAGKRVNRPFSPAKM